MHVLTLEASSGLGAQQEQNADVLEACLSRGAEGASFGELLSEVTPDPIRRRRRVPA